VAETPTGWQLLHAQLPKAALKELATSVYGVAGLTDVNEGYLIQRLFASGLPWEWRIRKQEYLGFEDKTSQSGKEYRVYMAAVLGRLEIQDDKGWRVFDGSGASDNRKLDAAYKGAATVAFKNACKLAGLTAELYLDGRAIDHIYSERVLKDQTMVPEQRIQAAVEWAERQVAEGAAGSDQRQGSGEASDKRGATSVERPDGAVTQTPPQQTQPAQVATSPQPQSEEADPTPVPTETGEIDLTDLFALGRTLRTPVTNLVVKNQVAEHGIEGVRRRLILAHARDHGPACEHVAQLAGLAVRK
jgi:hypothetical protein